MNLTTQNGWKENTSDFATCNKVFIVKKKIQTEKLTIKFY